MSDFSFRKKKGLTFYRKKIKIKKGVVGTVFECIFIALIVSFVAFVLVWLFGIKTAVVGSSMEPGLHNTQEVYMDRMIYLISAPKRGDVIAFLPKGNEKTHYYIKRVIAVSGEKIQIKDGRIYIDGKLFEDEYGSESIRDAGLAENEFELKEDEFFVLGDNRNFSEDSRSGNIGAVNRKDIYGKVWFSKKTDEYKGGFVK